MITDYKLLVQVNLFSDEEIRSLCYSVTNLLLRLSHLLMKVIFLRMFKFSAVIIFFSLINISAIDQSPSTKVTLLEGEETTHQNPK